MWSSLFLMLKIESMYNWLVLRSSLCNISSFSQSVFMHWPLPHEPLHWVVAVACEALFSPLFLSCTYLYTLPFTLLISDHLPVSKKCLKWANVHFVPSGWGHSPPALASLWSVGSISKRQQNLSCSTPQCFAGVPVKQAHDPVFFLFVVKMHCLFLFWKNRPVV